MGFLLEENKQQYFFSTFLNQQFKEGTNEGKYSQRANPTRPDTPLVL